MAVWVGNCIGDYDMFDAYYNGVRGQLLRHIITRNVIGTANAKYGGGDWPAPAANLLTGSGAEIPNVVGLTPEAAKALLESLGFSFADGGQVDSDADAGKIVQTDPAAGTQSAKGALVTVYTSKANMKAFPDVVGDGTQFTFGQAQSTLGTLRGIYNARAEAWDFLLIARWSVKQISGEDLPLPPPMTAHHSGEFIQPID